jgi:hypothetical protein
MSVRIVELARHDTRSLTRAVRNDIALLKECEVHACVAAINMAPLTGCRCLLRYRAINISLLRSEEQAETIRFHLRPEPALGDFLMLSALFLTRLLRAPWLAILDQSQIVRIDEVITTLLRSG